MKDVFDHLPEGAKHAFDLLSIASLLGFLTSRSRSGPTLRAGEVGCVAGRERARLTLEKGLIG